MKARSTFYDLYYIDEGRDVLAIETGKPMPVGSEFWQRIVGTPPPGNRHERRKASALRRMK